jgi:hypothetical protein
VSAARADSSELLRQQPARKLDRVLCRSLRRAEKDGVLSCRDHGPRDVKGYCRVHVQVQERAQRGQVVKLGGDVCGDDLDEPPACTCRTCAPSTARRLDALLALVESRVYSMSPPPMDFQKASRWGPRCRREGAAQHLETRAMEGGEGGKKKMNKNKGKGAPAVLPPYLGGDSAAPDLNAAFTRVKEARERLDRALEMKNRATSLYPNERDGGGLAVVAGVG